MGIEIIRIKIGVWLSQRKYAFDMLKKHGMADYKPISHILDPNVKLGAHEGRLFEDPIMYQKVVGSLI